MSLLSRVVAGSARKSGLVNTSVRGLASGKKSFEWTDALMWKDMLTEDEKMMQDSAIAYCEGNLLPRVIKGNRDETFHLCFP